MLMNFGFFGIQYSFGMQQTAVNPIYQFLGASPESLPILNLAGPVTGLLIQPLIGALSDRTWSDRWGRRKPYFLLGAVGCSICLFLFPFVSAVWMAVLLLWLLDASNNTAMEPFRAFIADKLPDSQLARGFLTQSFFTGLGITLANLSLFVFQKIITGGTAAGIPYWVFGSFMLGAVCSIASVLVTVLSTKEIPPTPAELELLRSESKGFLSSVSEIGAAIREMPVGLRKLSLVYLFQWYAMNIYWQYVTLAAADTAWGTHDPHSQAYQEAVAWTGVINGTYNIVTFCCAFGLVALAKKIGPRYVHSVCLILAALGLAAFPMMPNKEMLLVPIVGLGIAWASIMGVPYIMAVRMIPKERYGVYMGIINMMIVIPMLIQTLSFGWVYSHVLSSSPGNALRLAAGCLFVAAVLMQWINVKKDGAPDLVDTRTA
ncbi:MFS transporter [Nanchangia anserum]|uniref:MFS transporter n=2 Tax=Nanchangia anserum TaxID=2692125 RepID=A0A8I0G9V6_9ACTO|nr:MFS transporter [Nanchangia anserum]QOX82611.1 MFS transporter [Nanchangia anserum]